MTADFNFLSDIDGHEFKHGRQLLPSSFVEKYAAFMHEQSIEESDDQSVHQVLLPQEALHLVAGVQSMSDEQSLQKAI